MNRQSFYKNVLGGFKEEGIRIMVEEMAIVKSYRLLDVVSLGAGCAVSADVRDWIGGKQRRKNRRVCVLWCVEPNRTNGHGVCVRESPNDLHNKIRFVLGQRMRCLGNVRQNLCQGFTWNMKWGRWGRRKNKRYLFVAAKSSIFWSQRRRFSKKYFGRERSAGACVSSEM